METATPSGPVGGNWNDPLDTHRPLAYMCGDGIRMGRGQEQCLFSSAAASTSPMPSGPSSIRTESSPRIAGGTMARTATGCSAGSDGRAYVVVYTLRGSAVRIVSARKANRKEGRGL